MHAQNEPAEVAVRLLEGEIAGSLDPDIPGAWVVDRIDESALAEGRIWPQSRASQLVGLAVGARAGERTLDLCAAPGGKATMLAGEVVAVDVNEARAHELEVTARRLGASNVQVVVADGRKLPPELDGFDRALVDAPCSGLGVLNRAPIYAGAPSRFRLSNSNFCGRRQSASGLAERSSTRCARSTPRSRRPWSMRPSSRSIPRSPRSGRSSGIPGGPSSCRRSRTSTARPASSSRECVPEARVRPRIEVVDDALFERVLELAERGRGTTHPNPVVGAAVVAAGAVVGEGWHELKGGAHAEVNALADAGDKARGATMYVTLEPCAHQGDTPPCADALIEAGVARVVAGQLDPHPDHTGGLARLEQAGIQVELATGEIAFRCRQQIEEWRTWVTAKRPFVTYKVAVSLDGRIAMPDSRWVSGEDSRRLVHVLRAASDAVAVGMGTVRWENPRLDARGVPVVRQPRRLAFGRGPLPPDSELELRSGALREELEALADDGVQSLLLEGGPTLAAAFLEQDLVDKLLVFVAPKLSGDGSGMLAGLPAPIALTRLESRPIGDDVVIQGYVHEP